MTDDQNSSDETHVWIFQGEGVLFPCAVFTQKSLAENWISENRVSGILTAYPLNQSVYDWVIEQGYWKPQSPSQETPQFVQSFSSAYAEHDHYQDGQRMS